MVVFHSHDISLTAGWNIISVTVDISLEDFIQLSSNIIEIQSQNELWRKDSPIGNTLTTISPIKGYYVLVNQNTTITLEGDFESTYDITLYTGWTFVGIPMRNNELVFNVDFTLPDNTFITQIKSENLLYDPDDSNATNINSFVKGRGYWINVAQETLIEFVLYSPEPEP